MSKIKTIRFFVVRRPLKITFATSLGQKNYITSVIVKTQLSDGSLGLGEIPTSFAVKNENVNLIQHTLKNIIPSLINTNISEYENIVHQLRKKYIRTPMTISGIETSLFRAYLNQIGISEYKYWCRYFNQPETSSAEIETDITIPLIKDFGLLENWISFFVKQKFKIFKIKTSGELDFDKKLINFVHNKLKEVCNNFLLRIDANQAYTTRTFLQFINFISQNKFNIQLIEQPLKKNDYKGLKYIKKYSYIPIILDETVFTINDLHRVISENLSDGINIKIAKSGISQAAEMLKIAKKHKLYVMLGCMTETIVGLSSAINFAFAINKNLDFVDLDSIFFLYHKNKYNTIKIIPPKFVLNF